VNKNGSALIIVLIIMTLILTISVAIAALGINPLRFVAQNALYDQAVYAAQDFSSKYINAIKQQFVANQGTPPDPNQLGMATSQQYNTGNSNIEVDMTSADYTFYPDQNNWTDCHYDLTFVAKDLNSQKNVLRYIVHFDINNSPPNAALLTNKDYNSGGTAGGNWWLGGFSRVVGPYYTNDSIGIANWQNANANTNPPTAPMFDALNRFVPNAPALPDLRVGGSIIWYGNSQPSSNSDWKKIAYQGSAGVQQNYPKYSFTQNVLGRGVNLLPSEAKGQNTLTGSNNSFVAFNKGFSSIVGGNYYSLYINPSAINNNYSVDKFEFSSMRMNFKDNGGRPKYASVYRITLTASSNSHYRIWLIDIPRASGSTATDTELSTKIFYVQKNISGVWVRSSDPPFNNITSCPPTSDQCNPYIVTDRTDFNLIYINGHIQEMQTSTLSSGDYNSSSDLYNALKLSGHGSGSSEDLADVVAGRSPANPMDPASPWQWYVSGRLTVGARGDIVIGDGRTNYLNYSLTYPERLVKPDGSFTSYSGTTDSRFLLGLVARNIFLNVSYNASKPPAKPDYANDGTNVSDNQTYSFDGQILTFGTQTGNNDNTIQTGVFDNYHYYSNVATGNPASTSNYPYFSGAGNDNLLGYALTRGMLVENWHGVWGVFTTDQFGNGFLENGYQDEYVYDNRLRYFVTPWFPLPKNPSMPANYSMTVEIVKL